MISCARERCDADIFAPCRHQIEVHKWDTPYRGLVGAAEKCAGVQFYFGEAHERPSFSRPAHSVRPGRDSYVNLSLKYGAHRLDVDRTLRYC